MTKLINILMQRNACNVPWGFDIQERQHLQQPLIINRVLPKAVAAHNLKIGDVILQIQDKNVVNLTNAEIRDIINRPLNDLHLIILQNKNPKIQHNPPVTVIKPVANAAPSRKPKPDPVFNKLPVYKPVVPKLPMSNVYKPNIPVGYQRPQTPPKNNVQPPKKVIRDFVKDEPVVPKLYNFLNNESSLLGKKKNYFESINSVKEQKPETRPRKKLQEFYPKNDKSEFSLPNDFYKSNHRKSLAMETPKFQWNQTKYSSQSFLENREEINKSLLTNESMKKDNNIDYKNVKDKNLRNLGRCFSDLNLFSNKKPFYPSYTRPVDTNKKVYDFIQNRYGDTRHKNKCDLIMTEYISSEDDTNSTTTEVYRDFSSEELSVIESTKDDDESLYMYEVLSEKTLDKSFDYQPNQIVIKSETLNSFPRSTKSTYSKINSFYNSPVEKSATQIIPATKINYQHPYGQSLKMKEKYFEKYLQDALADNEEIVSANLVSYQQVESKCTVNGQPKGHLFKNDIKIEIRPEKFSDFGSTLSLYDKSQNGYCESVSSFQGDQFEYEPYYSRQQSVTPTLDNGASEQGYTGVPPPPPPPGPGNIAAKRLSTEIPDRRLEPPACVQNAMMTKDKKPFTYTPGGLDLSQIKSPRMARRVNRNAHAEGVSDVPKTSPLAHQPGQLPPAALAAMQPQLPVAVFPTGAIPPPPPPPTCPSPQSFAPPPPPPQQQPPTQNNKPTAYYQKPDMKSIIPPNPTAMLRPTGGPHRRDVEDDIGRVAKPQLGTLYIPPVESTRSGPTPRQVESPVLNKAPTPWLTQRQPAQQTTPPWAHGAEQQSFPSPPAAKVLERRISDTDGSQKTASPPGIQFQHRPQQPPFQQQQKMPQQQQQQVYQQQRQQPQQNQQQLYQQQPQQQKTNQFQPGTRIIPIQIESSGNNGNSFKIENDPRRTINTNGNIPPPEVQFAKMQLQEDDQNLMQKFRNQVDEDTYLHNETDPRYRGAAIPSRAFRMLQTMTDTSPDSMPAQTSTAPRGPVVRTIPIRRAYQDGNESQQYIPPSEQQVAEPRKYTGSAIPSRSFRMLQAMTSPNNNLACENSQYGENNENHANDPYYAQWSSYDPNYPPHPYWNNPYWGYYDPNQCYSPNPNSEEADYSQYWDPYYYYYPYPPTYSPQHFYNQDTDNEGTSSCDEMTYYGGMFPKMEKQPTPDIVVSSVQDAEEEESDDESDTDTETENKSSNLLAIKSVSDINVYENSELTSKEESSDEESEEDDNEETYAAYEMEDPTIPHQLSVIFEESEESESRGKTRQDSERTVTDLEEDETSITVKLPLKFNFSEPVTTVTVQPSKEIVEVITSPWESENVSYTINIPRKCEEEEEVGSDSEVSVCVSIPLKKVNSTKSESDCDSDDESTSSSGDSSSESSSEDEDDEPIQSKPRERTDSEKEKLILLLEKASMKIEKEEVVTNVKDRIKLFENIKNEQTDEEDSGLGTSDVSRHISETDSTDCLPELRKMNKYQRAATHSRLFKLLQDECSTDESISIAEKKEQMTLQFQEDGISSAISSPISPTVNDRLVKELVQSLLKRKKGKCFREIPLEKLHAAALRILQEDMDHCDTISSSDSTTHFLSPLPAETLTSSPDFTNDYTAYYNTWAEYDILPSRTFKHLQNPTSNKILAKCPRVLSSKNLHKDLQRVAEVRETPSPLLESST